MRVNDVKFFNQLASVHPTVEYQNNSSNASGDDDTSSNAQNFTDMKRPVVMQATITLYLVEESLANQYADVEEGTLDEASGDASGSGDTSASSSEASTPPA